MWTSTARLAIALVVSVPLAAAIRNTEGSHCTKWCGNNQAVTADDEIFCTEPSLQTSGGGLWENCVKCQLTSPYVNGNDSDLGALLYNLRRALDKCLFEPGTQCATSTACGPLKNAIEYRNNITTGIGLYDFCPQWAANVALEHCSPCVRVLPMNTDGGKYIDNFVHILEAACEQKPEPGSTISVSGDPFSEDSPVVIVPPQTTHASVPMPDYGPISLGARVGIAFGVLALILAVVGYCIVCNGKRRRRAFLRQLERRHGANQGWPHPSTRYGGNGGGAGGDMFETPISQKALRGWENESPISAMTENTERTFPRYFSPYSSQFNSPVSAPGTSASATANWPSLSPLQPNTQRLEQLIQTQSPVHGSPPPAFTQWPSPRHEQTIMQTQTLQEKRQQEIAIGLALGGDEASLRSKTSNGAMKADSPYGYPTDTKGKGRAEEAYELREVPSPFSNNGGEVSNNPYYQMPTPPEAPVLRHPGHGRMPGGSRPGSNEGGVTGLGLHTVPISQ